MSDGNSTSIESVSPTDDNKPIGSVAKVVGLPLPIHAVTGGQVVKRRPGRPKKINPRPTMEDLDYHAETSKLKDAFIQQDPLVKAASSGQTSIEVLQRIKTEIARESAALLFARNEEEKYGRDTSQMSSRRISALREIASLEMEIRTLGSTVIDLRSEQFQKIISYFLECIKEVAVETLTTEQVNIFFNRLETRLEDWEERAQNLVR
jgi:hypothetical protein